MVSPALLDSPSPPLSPFGPSPQFRDQPVSTFGPRSQRTHPMCHPQGPPVSRSLHESCSSLPLAVLVAAGRPSSPPRGPLSRPFPQRVASARKGLLPLFFLFHCGAVPAGRSLSTCSTLPPRPLPPPPPLQPLSLVALDIGEALQRPANAQTLTNARVPLLPALPTLFASTLSGRFSAPATLDIRKVVLLAPPALSPRSPPRRQPRLACPVPTARQRCRVPVLACSSVCAPQAFPLHPAADAPRAHKVTILLLLTQ